MEKMNRIQKNQEFFRSNFFLIKNRKGWIRVIEAFVAVLLISGVALIVLDKESSQGTTSNLAQDTELAILRSVQLDDNLRDEISPRLFSMKHQKLTRIFTRFSNCKKSQ